MPSESKMDKSQCAKDFGATTSAFMDCIILFWCLCGICIGFITLNRPESVSALNSILIERFPDMPPELFFDFACGLLRNGIGVAPWHLERIRICQDCFHGGKSLDVASRKSHCSSCSAAYETKFDIDAARIRETILPRNKETGNSASFIILGSS